MKKPMRIPSVSLLLIVSFLFLSPFLSLGDPSASSISTSINEPDNINLQSDPNEYFRPASGPTKTGVLPAIEFIQSGTNIDTTGLISARTDETPSVVDNLTLDTANGWKSDQIELNITELRKLLALNGTFGDGYPGINIEPSGSVPYYPLGWDADSSNDEPSKQTLRASYNDTGRKFIELELEGEPDVGPDFKVFRNSEVYWFQDITRSASEIDFLLSFDLLYDSGPIGTGYIDDFQLRIEAGSMVLWSMDPVTIPARDLWNHIGPIPISLDSVPTSFELRFVFEILESRTLEGDREDFDDDWDNAQFVRFHVDDISLTSADNYDPQDVNMRVQVSPLGSTYFSGTTGNAHVLLNNSYWESSPEPVTILADDAVSFDYEARFTQVYRNVNTSWTNNPIELGIDYSVDTGKSPSLTAYVFIPIHSNIDDFTLELPHPPDYDNVTVIDTSSTDVTSFCTLGSDKIIISGPVLDSFGWWKVHFETPNYAREITTQRYTSSWENHSVFSAQDQIRALVGISTPTSIPALLENLSIDWVQPNGTLWFGEVRDDGTDGVSYSQDLNLDAYNATQGLWEIRVFWNNGTEIAYGETYFELFHSSSLTPTVSFIEAEPSTTITVSAYLRDSDTNDYLIDETSTVVGNWSGQVVVFQRNLAKAWWEGDLNTSLVGFGNFTILLNASTPYYTSSSCTITVEISSYTILTHYGPEYVNLGLGGTYDAKFRYSSSDGTGIEGAVVEVITVIGPGGGLSIGSTVAVPGQAGNYTIEFQVDIGGSYFVVVSASKVGHDTETVSFNIVTSAISTNLLLLNGTADVLTIGDSYNLAIQYLNETGEALEGATITVVDVVPSSGLTFDPTQPQGNGTYTIMVNADLTGIYSISVRASLAGYDTQIRMFTLVVSSTPSILSVDPTVSSIAADQDYTLIVTFTDSLFVGLENGSISVISVNPSTGLSISGTSELGSGLYSITLTPSTKGTYNLVLRGSLQNYQNSTALFTLVVTDVPTSIRTSDGLVSGYCYFTDTLEITLLYERTDNDTFIQGAMIEISTIVGLNYGVVEIPQGYVLTLNPTLLGHWSLTFRAFKSQYSNASMIFDFEVREAITSLSGNGLGSILFIGVSYDFMLSYVQNDSLGIDSATVIQTYRGTQVNPFLWVDNNDGTYSFTMTASELGAYVVSIEFSKYGFAPAESSLSFNVSRHTFVVPAEDRLNTTYSLLQGGNLHLSLRLTTGDTGEEIFDAVVSFLIVETGTSGFFENHTDGSYTATIPVPSEAGTYSLRFSIQKEQYTDTELEVVLISEVDSAALTARIAIIGVEVAALFLGVASVVYIGRRRLRRTALRKQVELLNIRERFSDASNIIGFLVIQRSNGLPIYSRIIKGGFEMSIISGFISAISHFSEELRTEEKLWAAIPISEVVMAVHTEELICSLLTVEAPSRTLVENLEEVSIKIGSKFDGDPNLLSTISRSVDSALEYKSDFDRFFETRFDFKLLVSYTSYDLSRKGEYPLIELAIISGDMNRPFYVSELVRYLMTSGVEETRAYSMVIDATESGFLLSLDKP